MIILEEETSWRRAKICISDPNFLINLRKFKCIEMNSLQLKKLFKVINRPGFDDIQKNSNTIGEYLLRYWVTSIFKLATTLQSKGLLTPK